MHLDELLAACIVAILSQLLTLTYNDCSLKAKGSCRLALADGAGW